MRRLLARWRIPSTVLLASPRSKAGMARRRNSFSAGSRSRRRLVEGSMRGSALFVAVSLAFAMSAATPAGAQQADLDAIHKRYEEFRSAGNHAAALVEAQRYEAGTKARYGANHANYAAALYNLGLVYKAQGADAEAQGILQARARHLRKGARARTCRRGRYPPPSRRLVRTARQGRGGGAALLTCAGDQGKAVGPRPRRGGNDSPPFGVGVRASKHMLSISRPTDWLPATSRGWRSLRWP